MDRVFIKETDAIQYGLFLTAIYQRYAAGIGLSKNSKRRVFWSGHGTIIGFIPTILIMITGKIQSNGIGRKAGVHLMDHGIQSIGIAFSGSYFFHHLKNGPGIRRIKSIHMIIAPVGF